MPNFKSGFERTLATQIKAAGVPLAYETLKIHYKIDHIYTPDFVLPNGIIIEAKGYFRKGDTAKYKAVKYQNPELDIRFVFMDEDKKIPGQKQTHGEWCKRHGFPVASGRIPTAWFT